ncbi:hypothetical protein DPQ33_00740 [Oceanidesulfovibrio indonesiensis]|uniref:DUF3880 domain-containing protein n=1 Tax=Oceanidesulfovibrio indonesiensis TaxID=54767 RepID=A0A7M3MJ08_9BACT|nr:glycosyltransferase [Oceanidesulfovibrio indonesiensis]TVM19797.1 hypothetical protein DPQ33_00740 [Oceanidesulfovibrio indonesiensis]
MNHSGHTRTYRAEPVMDEAGRLVDVRVHVDAKVRHIAGRSGPAQEETLLRSWREARARGANVLPVFLGAGMGGAVRTLLDETAHDEFPTPVAVVDKEQPILDITGLRDGLAADYPGRILFLDDDDPKAVLADLTRWQINHGGAPLLPLAHPFYLRLDSDYYPPLRASLAASGEVDFWARTRYPKFRNEQPRMLLVTSQYFLMGEIEAACKRLGVPHRFVAILDEEIGTNEFVEQLLTAVVEFRPDFVFTINHLGVDREGVLMELLDKLGLPLASWFVDNPHLILYLYKKVVSTRAAIFTWDADNLATLRQLGFDEVHYLPLATDPHRFRPPNSAVKPLADVAFVGNSMVFKVGHRMRVARPPKPLLTRYRQIAAEFGEHEERSVRRFLETEHPDLAAHFESLDTLERRLAFEAMITWEATRQYRLSCLQGVMDLNPLIAGDRGWRITLRHDPRPWRYHHELSYYADLPGFYPRVAVNFNATSKQMKGAVNQRVFDAPAAGAFVLTDWREQMDRLFEPGAEVVAYRSPEEAAELAQRYVRDEPARKKIAAAARQRILAQHTYDIRVSELLETMRQSFG